MRLHPGCPGNDGLLNPPPTFSGVRIKPVFTDKKAFIDIESGELSVDPRYYDSLSEDSKACLMFHELAHTQPTGCARFCEGKPDGCERCADNRLGACMALSGYSRDRTKRALVGMELSRTTLLDDALAGFDAASRQKVSVEKSTTTSTQPPTQHTTIPRQTTLTPLPVVPVVPTTPSIIDSAPALPIPDPGLKPIPAPPVSVVEDGSCAYDFAWVVGVAGGVMAAAILLTKWAMK